MWWIWRRALSRLIRTQLATWLIQRLVATVSTAAAERFGYEVLGPILARAFEKTGSRSQLIEDNFQRAMAALASGVNRRLDADDDS